jgi:uncharacterized small protein (TIGR04563 family)
MSSQPYVDRHRMPGTAPERKLVVYFDGRYADELVREAWRQRRSMSWLVRKAWELSRSQIRAIPTPPGNTGAAQ